MSYLCIHNHNKMSDPKTFKIKESNSEIKKLIKSSHPMIAKRLQALLVFKQHEEAGISKRQVADYIGVDHNSIQTWRNLYIDGGIEKLTSHSKTGFKPSLITAEQEKAIEEQMHKPDNGFVGFIELLEWFNEKFETDVNYKTFHGFVVRKFEAKIKTARKVHVKKDQGAVDTFKKTSVRNVKKSSKTKVKGTKK
jgi:transposase